MGYFSVTCVAARPVRIPGTMILLDTGRQVFTITVPDREGLLKDLRDLDVQVLTMTQLDDFSSVTEALDPEEPLLPPGSHGTSA